VSKPLVVLVCGGRGFNDFEQLCVRLDMVHITDGIALLVHGGAQGADYLADRWARMRKVPRKPYPANWTRNGRAAGPIRNQTMLDNEPIDLVVAFPGGRGTADMVRRAKRAGISVQEIPCR
jgi:hypothetical protein